MDMPPPLLERLKKHFALSSSNTSPPRQVHLNLANNDATTISARRQSDAAELSPGTGKLFCREITGRHSNSNSLCNRINDADRKQCKSRHNSARKGNNRRNRVPSPGSSNSEFRNNTSSESNDSFLKINNAGSCSHISKDGSTEQSVFGVVPEGGGFSSGKGSQSNRRKGTRNLAEISGSAASSSSHSADARTRDRSVAQEVDTISTATSRTTLSARGAWTSSLHKCGNITWVCQGIYAHEGFHCVYLLRSLRSPRCTYIGYSVNPLHRLRQHNGEVSQGGAWKTRRHRPWALVLVVYGFPHAVAALQFEWRWQRAVPVPREADAVAGRHRKKPDMVAGLPKTTTLRATSAASTKSCNESVSSRILQPFAQTSSNDSYRQFVSGDVSAGGHTNSSAREESVEVIACDGTSPVRRMAARRSPAKSLLKTTVCDLRTETPSASAIDAATFGGKALLKFSSEKENTLHKAGVNTNLLSRKEGDLKPIRAPSIDAYSSHDHSALVNDFSELPCKSSRLPYCRSSAERITCLEEHKRVCGTSNATANTTPVDSRSAKQASSYRLSRTGNGIVARVGLRLRTLVALLHVEPFRHMPLGVHVVDAYTAAPYFRLLVRERKLADPHQQQRRNNMTGRCIAGQIKSRAHMTRRSAWMLLQRSLDVSFGEPALLLPLINRSQKKGRKERRTESNTSSVSATDSHAGAGMSGREAVNESYHHPSGLSSKGTCSSYGESASTTETVEDSAWASQPVKTSIDSIAASGDDVFAVEDFGMSADCVEPLVNDRIPSPSCVLPRCTLCGCEFLRELRQRPASRCGKCLCFYHLTCLARSVFDKKPGPPARTELSRGLDKCNNRDRENESSTSEWESCGSERTRGSPAAEGYSLVDRYPGLVSAEAKCPRCGFSRSWAEVLADGVVLSIDGVQETSPAVYDVSCEQIKDDGICT